MRVVHSSQFVVCLADSPTLYLATTIYHICVSISKNKGRTKGGICDSRATSSVSIIVKYKIRDKTKNAYLVVSMSLYRYSLTS